MADSTGTSVQVNAWPISGKTCAYQREHIAGNLPKVAVTAVNKENDGN